MRKLPVTIDDGENEPVTIELPAHWEICSRCAGDGTSSAYLGSFTREDFIEDPDFAEDYMSGVYDRPCEKCHGSGKVLEINRDACTTEDQKRALAHLDDEAEYKRQSFAERKAESLMLGESRLEDWDGVYPD